MTVWKKINKIEGSAFKFVEEQSINLSFGFFSLIIQRDSGSDCDFFDELIATGY